MKVVHIGDNALFGHRFNGHDLGKHLRECGIQSDHLVWSKNSDDAYTHAIAGHWMQRDNIRDVFNQLNAYYNSNALFYPFSYELLFNKIFLESDVVHLHLIHNFFFGLEHLPIISRVKPVVWTVHDAWAIAGHCIHSLQCDRWLIGCGDCPDLSRPFSIRLDASALNWEYKKLIIQASELDIIVASQWMYDRVSKSEFFKNAAVHLVNFGLDLNHFKPHGNAKAAKRKFGIPAENIVIALRGASWIYKGMDYVRESLKMLATTKSISLLVFNEKGLLNEFSDRFQIVELGWVDDDAVMIDAYGAADIFIMPSTAEAFGMMAMEAMACAKPVIVMDGTALPGVVRPEESGGIVVPQGDVNALTFQLEHLINNPDLCRQIGERSRIVAEKYYNKNRYLNEIIAVYKATIERKRNDQRARFIVEQQKKIDLSMYDISLPQSYPIYVPQKEISDKEEKLLSILHKINDIPAVNWCYRRIAKPAYRFLMKVMRRIK